MSHVYFSSNISMIRVIVIRSTVHWLHMTKAHDLELVGVEKFNAFQIW